jgi:hypothetical protein
MGGVDRGGPAAVAQRELGRARAPSPSTRARSASPARSSIELFLRDARDISPIEIRERTDSSTPESRAGSHRCPRRAEAQ